MILPQADGSSLQLAAPAATLVTLSPHLAELVFAAGAGGHLIATVEYSEYPPAASEVPRIGDAFRIDSERILSLQPDLVIAWDSGNPRQAITQLMDLGLAVWTVEIRDVTEIAAVIEQIGAAGGEQAAAHLAATQFRQRLERLEQYYSARPAVDYFYQVAARPLFTVNGEHLISKGLGLCGGHNIFQDQAGLAFQVSHESVLLANPQALFAPTTDSEADPFAPWREWPLLRAVRDQALFLLPADKISRATPRMLDAIELACDLLDGLRERINYE